MFNQDIFRKSISSLLFIIIFLLSGCFVSPIIIEIRALTEETPETMTNPYINITTVDISPYPGFKSTLLALINKIEDQNQSGTLTRGEISDTEQSNLITNLLSDENNTRYHYFYYLKYFFSIQFLS